MPLTDILSFEQDDSNVMTLARGNIGTVNDISDNIGSTVRFKTVLPDDTDVLNGVQYGQNGTEFTGLMTPIVGGGVFTFCG